jgi:hypothetical protein
MRGTKAGFAVAAATLALGACGSSEGAARDAVTGYLGAVADGDGERAMLRDAEVEVEVNGDQATATIVASGQEVPLRKIEGEWLIDGGLFQ